MHPNQERKLERLEAAWTVVSSRQASNPVEYEKAKQELAKYRIKLRHERDAAIEDGDAVAKLTTLSVKAKRPQIGDK